MYRYAVCDDNQRLCQSLKIMINKTMKYYTNKFIVDVYYSTISLLEQLKSNKKYDVMFLNVRMEGLNGIELGEIIRRYLIDEHVNIIYISRESGYAIDLFKVRAFDFLIKPITLTMVEHTIQRVMKYMQGTVEDFHFQMNGKCIQIKQSRIVYLMSMNRKIKLVTLDGDYEFYGKLDDIQKKLEENNFWRIHQSYIINYHHSSMFAYERVVLNNHMTLPISQRYRKAVKMKLKSLIDFQQDFNENQQEHPK